MRRQQHLIRLVLAAGLAAGLIGCLTDRASRPAPALRAAARGRCLIGAAIDAQAPDDPLVRPLLERHFASVTPDNLLKPDALQPREGEFTFDQADRLVDFARARGLAVEGHTLVWHHQTPDWFFKAADGGPVDRATALRRLETHITTVMRHYQGRVCAWDVVNEALSDVPGEYLRETPWLRAIGADYILWAFRFAQAADPTAELYYNDYNLEIPSKRDQALRLLADLRAAGARVNAVGLQAHYTLRWPAGADPETTPSEAWPDAATIEQTVLDFHAAGFPVMFTELDVNALPGDYNGAEVGLRLATRPELDPFRTGCPPAVLAAQARVYGAVFDIACRHPDKVRRVSTWGVTDAQSWLNNWPFPGRVNHPLLFDRAGRPKPAFFAAWRALTGRH